MCFDSFCMSHFLAHFYRIKRFPQFLEVCKRFTAEHKFVLSCSALFSLVTEFHIYWHNITTFNIYEMRHMQKILVCNQKHSVGKSLVADEIAFSFERSGIPVSFHDLDTQGSTLHKTHEADGSQAGVADTPGALQEALSDWLKKAGAAAIPTRITSRDRTLMCMRKAMLRTVKQRSSTR